MRCSDRLPALLLAAGFLHVLEESLCGWVSWSHRFIPGVSWFQFLAFNALFLAYLAIALRLRYPLLALSVPFLLLLNVPIHLIPTLWTGTWSPGLASALLLYVPLATWRLWQARREGTTWDSLLRPFFLAALLMALPFIFQLLRLTHSC